VRRGPWVALLLLSAPAFGAEPTFSSVAAPAGVLTSEAREALQRMSAYRAGAKTLAYEADVTYDVMLRDG